MIYLLSELVLFFGIIFIFLYWLYFYNNININRDIMLLSIWFLLLSLFILIKFEVESLQFFFNFNFIISPLIKLIKIFILILGIIIIYVNWFFLYKKNQFEIFILILFLILNFLILTSINELILLILFIEIHSIIAFTLTGINDNLNLSKEAMLKFFILGAVSSVFMGIGVSIIYVIFGSSNINELYNLITNNLIMDAFLYKYYIIGIIFFFFGFFFKLALVPFHFWIGDVYQSAPLGIIFFFATIPALVYVNLFLKLYFFLNTILICVILLLSIVYGTFMSLYQVKLMRLIGYSAIIHISFSIIGGIQNNLLSEFSSIFYIIVYCFLNISLFFIILMLKKNNKIGELDLVEIVDFLKIFKYGSFFNIVLASIFLSMGGIPPLSGFFIKWYIFYSLMLNYNIYFLIFLLIIGVVNAIYYIRLVRLLFFNDTKKIFIDNWTYFVLINLLILIFLFLLNIFFLYIHVYIIINIMSFIL